MKLIELKILSDYKKIKSGTVFKFKKKDILGIVGENGSGKTILFELITDILSVSILTGDKQKNILKDNNLAFLMQIEIKDKVIFIEKELNSDLVETYTKNFDGDKENYLVSNELNLITYSSAKRSILSNTHYNILLNLLEKSESIDSSNNFNTYVREKIKKIIIIYLCIFKKDYLEDIFKNVIDIKLIKKIEIAIHKKHEKKIEFFKQILKREFLEERESIKIILEEEDIEKIKEAYATNSQMFYYMLQNLELLNIKEILTRKKYINKNFVSEEIEDNYLNEQFNIEEIEFENNVTYRYLSEGELQLFETIGTVILFQGKEYIKENLYIFDEPTTHLNVNWMSKYITLLKKALELSPREREGKLESQIIFSTHNSDVMSDLPKANLHLIKNGEFKAITEETFGASELKLNRVYFGKLDSISENVKNELELEIKKIEDTNNLEELKKIEKRIELKFANSPEKFNLLRGIDERILELEDEN